MQRVLITGGAAGIGLAIARAFLNAGHRVFVCDRDERALAAAATELPGVKTGICDIAEPSRIEAMVTAAADALGGLDVLINNAGISGPTAPVQELEPRDWDLVLAVGVTGTFHVTRAAVPLLMRNPSTASIINLSSAAGRFGYANRSAYAASKWAIIGLTKSIALELGEHGVRVNAIAPGAVDGARARAVFAARAEAADLSEAQVLDSVLANQSIKHLVDPAEIGAMALFLASDAAKSISGQVIAIDGDMQRT